MITPIKKPRTLRNYLTYDLEWIPGTLQVRMVGVFDGNSYRCYPTIEAFIANELTHKNRGKWFYAHAGGLADFQFVLEQLTLDSGYRYEIGARGEEVLNRIADKGYRIKGSFSGSSAIINHVVRGKNAWHFIDSYWLLRDKLRNIGKWVGIQKGNRDECPEFYANASFAELREYNEIDCVILYKAIAYFESVLLELGGQLKMTQASCAMELFRRRFLKAPIETSKHVNEIARNAYFASRVEVFMKECGDALYYDINSSFPYSMTHAVPGELIGTYRGRLPDVGLYMADCTVTVPDSYMPPLPVRAEGRIFFPIGTWRSWYTNIDIQLLLEQGGRIEKVHESMAFAPCLDLRDYANTLFDLRKDAEGFPKLAYKYLLNSLYGKFAESSWKSGFVVNPPRSMEGEEGWTQLFPGAYTFEKQVPIPHMHVPMSTHITSIARRTIYNLMGYADQVHYCDTDGFSVDSPFTITDRNFDEVKELIRTQSPFRVTGKDLGAIKLEKVLRNGRYIQAKVYGQDGINAESGKELMEVKAEACEYCGKIHDHNVEGVKAKGFSNLGVAGFEKLINFEEVEYVRMRRIKENLRNGTLKPREDVIAKRLNRDAIGKRFFYPDGQSRPWHYQELQEIL